ncbi:MAG: ferritin-like domain-containing protein [Capsulimonadales bacterium]|nr:ferritin-like domain-containing protein [Capsulimonadales bacterium]
MNSFEELMRSPLQRRAFLTRMTAAGLGSAAVALLSGCGSRSGTLYPSPFTDPTNFPGIPGRNADETVLNYALTLEILEADLYRQALNLASGRSVGTALDPTLPAGPTGTGSYRLAVSPGGIAADRVAPAFAYLVQYAYVEAAHRDFLQTALASLGAPVARPNAQGYRADFGTTLESILTVIYAIEETGVRAYLGAAGFMNDPQLLTTAVAIHSTEARHSGAVAYVLGLPVGPRYLGGDRNALNQAQSPNPSPYGENTFQYYLEPRTVLQAVRPFIVGA